MLDQTKDVENKIVTYRVALDDIIKQLAIKRTELSTLAKRTVADFESSIPALNEKIAGLRAEIAKLDKLIADRNATYQSQRTSCIAEFEALKKSLTDDCNKKLAECSASEETSNKIKEEYKAKITALDKKYDELNAAIEAGISSQKTFQSMVANFESEKQIIKEELSKSKKELADSILQSDDLILRLTSDLAIVAKEKASWAGKQEQANTILARIDEANGILANATDKEKENKKREQELNTLQAQILADRKRNANRAAELDAIEQAVKAREENVRIFEQNVVGGQK